MNSIEKKILPSAGLLEGIPEKVSIRGMKGFEISTLFSSLTDAAIDSIIRGVTEPSLDPEKLCDEDKNFILHQTRVLTFGNKVEQLLKCPVCGHIHSYVFDYADFDVTYLESKKLNDTFLLADGTTVSKKIPSAAFLEELVRYKEKTKLSNAYTYLLLQVSRIDKVNGKKKSIPELIEFLENLPGNVLIKLSKFLETKFGLDTTFEATCEKCGSKFPGGLGINADLFREPSVS